MPRFLARLAFPKAPPRAPVNRFRQRRGRVLRAMIETLADQLGRDIEILDLGGRANYWSNVGLGRIARITLLNTEDPEIGIRAAYRGQAPKGFFLPTLGDARDLGGFADQSIDLIHANSVIEHVGDWTSMRAMANEMMRVGRAGWMQTPAWEFPVEPHFRVPFAHWLGKPAQARAMAFSVDRGYRELDRDGRRRVLEEVNLLSRGDVRALFPGRPLMVERVILAKSYMIHWMPAA